MNVSHGLESVKYGMSCHILQYSRSFCGMKFNGSQTPDEDGVVHSYVEKRIEMANCKECIRKWHEKRLDNLEDS